MSDAHFPALAFQLALPRCVRFGWGARVQLAELARDIGRRAWFVVGSRTLANSGVLAELRSQLTVAGIDSQLLATISREPAVADVDAAVARLRPQLGDSADLLIALGGGSAIDLAKAVAATATNRQGASVRDFLEGIGRGLTIQQPPLPVIAIPTTAGTGSEATRNAVLSATDPPCKKSLRSERLIPAAVILDPELTVTCPPQITAHSGMDAITQLIESWISRRSNAFTAALCREGLARAIPALPIAVQNPSDRSAREAMQYAAFLSGVALANSGLGLAHGVAAALGSLCDVPHGLACAVMLPSALRFNRSVSEPQLAAIGRLFPGGESETDTAAAAELAIHRIEALCRQVGIPASLMELGVPGSLVPELIAGSRGNSLSGNPRDVTDADLRTLLGELCE